MFFVAVENIFFGMLENRPARQVFQMGVACQCFEKLWQNPARG
jgi:hypothetical protein